MTKEYMKLRRNGDVAEDSGFVIVDRSGDIVIDNATRQWIYADEDDAMAVVDCDAGETVIDVNISLKSVGPVVI